MIKKYNEYVKETFIDSSGSMHYGVRNIFVVFDHIKNNIALDDECIDYIISKYRTINNLDRRIFLDNRETYYFIVAVYYYLIKNNKSITLSDERLFGNNISIKFENENLLDIIKTIDFDFKQSSEIKLIQNILTIKPEIIKDYSIKKFIWFSNLEDVEIVKTLKNANNFDLL